MDTMAMLWLLIGIISIQSAVSIDAAGMTLNQLEKMVADLKISHELLSQKISEIQFENDYFKASMKKLSAENERLKGRVHDLQDENQTQKKINSQFKMEIFEIKTLLKSNEFGEFIKTKFSFLQTDESTVLDTDEQQKDDFKTVKSIGNNSSNPGFKERGTAPDTFGKASSKRLLLSGNLLSFNVSYFEYIHY